ncbi:MAG: hypothetical protein JWS10_1937 [Cypionkella sp.]|uniref:hypothetical protein n=1 Tax=Cypionkella sp. TaxID=2811411 RepID=UPI002615ACC9|nr:hypothetical protein [Cypionkella sp.]MDB5659322.1 hypothetical protein [Cypionkella sp.]
MSQKNQIAQLQQVSKLLLDSRLAVLNAAARAKLESEAQLAGLTVPPRAAADVAEIAGALAALNYPAAGEIRARGRCRCGRDRFDRGTWPRVT